MIYYSYLKLISLLSAVLKAIGFDHHRQHGYYVKCVAGGREDKSKTVKISKEDSTVNWNENFSLYA